jgi:hypothetical protein
MVAIPVTRPVTTPADVMGATAVLLLLHVPPGDGLDNVTTDPRHNEAGPIMLNGAVTDRLTNALQFVVVSVMV